MKRFGLQPLAWLVRLLGVISRSKIAKFEVFQSNNFPVWPCRCRGTPARHGAVWSGRWLPAHLQCQGGYRCRGRLEPALPAAPVPVGRSGCVLTGKWVVRLAANHRLPVAQELFCLHPQRSAAYQHLRYEPASYRRVRVRRASLRVRLPVTLREAGLWVRARIGPCKVWPPRLSLRVLRCPPRGLISLGAARREIVCPPSRVLKECLVPSLSPR